jgi:hypothetical protein
MKIIMAIFRHSKRSLLRRVMGVSKMNNHKLLAAEPLFTVWKGTFNGLLLMGLQVSLEIYLRNKAGVADVAKVRLHSQA